MLYQVVERRDLLDLMDNVQKQINFGWEPIGGVSTSKNAYLQAMIWRE